MNKKELCKNIQNSVNKLTNVEIIELFKIILETGENYTKNNNGVFINLNWLNEETLKKLNNYILFCIKSQNEITKYEIIYKIKNKFCTSHNHNCQSIGFIFFLFKKKLRINTKVG